MTTKKPDEWYKTFCFSVNIGKGTQQESTGADTENPEEPKVAPTIEPKGENINVSSGELCIYTNKKCCRHLVMLASAHTNTRVWIP